MLPPHGFENHKSFLRYLECLKNITTKSVVTISLANHLSAINTTKCMVALIEKENSLINYGDGWLIDRRIILMSELPFKGGVRIQHYVDRIADKLRAMLGPAANYYCFKSVNAGTLVTHIDNRPDALIKLGAQNIAASFPRDKYTLQYH